jgi:hypothetical protein
MPKFIQLHAFAENGEFVDEIDVNTDYIAIMSPFKIRPDTKGFGFDNAKTVIALQSGNDIVVQESRADIRDKIRMTS